MKFSFIVLGGLTLVLINGFLTWNLVERNLNGDQGSILKILQLEQALQQLEDHKLVYRKKLAKLEREIALLESGCHSNKNDHHHVSAHTKEAPDNDVCLLEPFNGSYTIMALTFATCPEITKLRRWVSSALRFLPEEALITVFHSEEDFKVSSKCYYECKSWNRIIFQSWEGSVVPSASDIVQRAYMSMATRRRIIYLPLDMEFSSYISHELLENWLSNGIAIGAKTPESAQCATDVIALTSWTKDIGSTIAKVSECKEENCYPTIISYCQEGPVSFQSLISYGPFEENAKKAFYYEVKTQSKALTEAAAYQIFKDRPIIAILAPALGPTDFNGGSSLESHLVDTLAQTISSNDTTGYILYIGADFGDPYFDNNEKIEKTRKFIEGYFMYRPVYFELVLFRGTKGGPGFIWNGLMEHAFRQGCYYFYEVNDDMRILPRRFNTLASKTGPEWGEIFTTTLQRNNFLPEFGVTGPIDKNNHNQLTFTFVSRLHYIIFGYFFPWTLPNWYTDTWIHFFYTETNSLFYGPEKLTVNNINSNGSRYNACYECKTHYDLEIKQSCSILASFLHQRARNCIKYIPKSSACQKYL